MTHALALLLAVGGFAALALAMDRHQEDVLGRALPQSGTRTCRLIGWLLILACITLCVAQSGWGLGLVIASGHTSAGAGLVFCGLIALERRRQARTSARPARAVRPTPQAPAQAPTSAPLPAAHAAEGHAS